MTTTTLSKISKGFKISTCVVCLATHTALIHTTPYGVSFKNRDSNVRVVADKTVKPKTYVKVIKKDVSAYNKDTNSQTSILILGKEVASVQKETWDNSIDYSDRQREFDLSSFEEPEIKLLAQPLLKLEEPEFDFENEANSVSVEYDTSDFINDIDVNYL